MRSTKNMHRSRKYRKRRNDPRWVIRPLPWPEPPLTGTSYFAPELFSLPDLLRTLGQLREPFHGDDLPPELQLWLHRHPGFDVAVPEGELQKMVPEVPEGGAVASIGGMPVRESPFVPEGTIVLVERVPAGEIFFRLPQVRVITNVGRDPIDRVDPNDKGV
jgi:hypothetical protein